MRLLIFAIAALSVTACTTVPEQIQGEFPDISPQRADPGVIGTPVRWGGVILRSQNRGDRTCHEILSRELDKHLRPMQEDYSNGRFIACKEGFQDPMVFRKGREVTVIGTIRNIRVRNVDEFKYRYPVLDVDTMVLWEKRRRVVVYRGFHDPFYYRYPWGYPYWGYRPFGWPGGYAEERTMTPDPSIINDDGQGSALDYPDEDNPQ